MAAAPRAAHPIRDLMARLLALPSRRRHQGWVEHHPAKSQMVFDDRPLGRRITTESGCLWVDGALMPTSCWMFASPGHGVMRVAALRQRFHAHPTLRSF